MMPPPPAGPAASDAAAAVPEPFVLPAGRHRPVPSRARRSYSAGALTRRRWSVRFLKWVLPAGALALLATIVLWPEFEGAEERARLSFRRVLRATPEAIRVLSPRYQGLDEQNRPFNVTATAATQAGGEDIVDLESPRADIFQADGSWLLVESRTGRYDRPADRLDLRGDVTLWHDNGMLFETEEARVAVKAGDAEGDRPVAAQGSFGTITGEGFRLRDRGAVVIFTGNARAVLEPAR